MSNGDSVGDHGFSGEASETVLTGGLEDQLSAVVAAKARAFDAIATYQDEALLLWARLHRIREERPDVFTAWVANLPPTAKAMFFESQTTFEEVQV